jgi:MFS family permease
MLNIGHGRRDLVVALIGRMVSTFGDGVALVALTLRLQADGAHPYEVGLLLAAGVVPLLLLARPVGRLVDTIDSRRLLVGGGLAEVAAAIPLIFLHSVVPIVALVAVLGGAASLTGASWSALVPRIVGEDHLAEAVSAQTSLNVLALVGAPAAGGLLAAVFGSGVPLAVDAATFVVVTVAAALVRTRRVPDRVPTIDSSSPARGGFAILRADRVLAPLIAGVALVVVLVGMVDVVLVYLVRDTLHAGGVWYGVAEASWMAGMVAGSLGAGRVATERGQIRATIGGAALACAGLAGFAVAPTVAILVPLSVLGGVGNGYAGACLSTLLMSRTPDSARGRVSAAANAIFGGAQGVSLLLGGAVAVVLSPRWIYAVAGLLGLAAAGLVAVTHASPESETASPVGTPSNVPPHHVAGAGAGTSSCAAVSRACDLTSTASLSDIS